MKTYTITLSDAQNLALGYAAKSQQEWIENSVFYRCNVAMDEIVKICVDKCFEQNIPVPSTKDATVELAFQKGWVTLSRNISEPLPKP